ncbi:MAG: alpha-L-fucosidase [Chitinophagales bacterium]|nr:alpha-L-fucosidase [Chitinophagales bacterium]
MKKLVLIVLFIQVFFSLKAQNDSQLQPYAGSPGWEETKEERTKWFKDAKFGMFIHYGLYAGAGGYWPPNTETGKKYPQHYSEWIRNWANVSEPEYGDATKPLFTPEKGATDQWAKVAKEAGMKYAVLTTKHHDGYTLFNSTAPYSVKNDISRCTNISPKGRDVVGEYSQSMRDQGIKVGYYYSLLDWQHPDAVPQSRRWPLGPNPDHSRYTAYMNDHIEQLFSKYGKADLLWVDYSSAAYQGKVWNTRQLLDNLYQMQPEMVINNRFWNGLENDKGDYFTPEKYVPATGYPNRVFEVCHTMNESFGYSYHDNNWKTAKEVVHLLVDIVSKGGNLLLNVGPDPNGYIPQPSVDALTLTGKWLKEYGDAIYGTTASPFSKLPDNVRCTQKSQSGNTILYLHVLEWPENRTIEIAGLKNNVKNASLFGKNKAIKFKQEKEKLTFSLPEERPNQYNSIIVVTIEGKPDVENINMPVQKADRSIFLSADYASISGGGARTENQPVNIGYWSDVSTTVSIPFKVLTPGNSQAGGTVSQKPGKYKVIVDVAAAEGAGGVLRLITDSGNTELDVNVVSTGSWTTYKKREMGMLTLSKVGNHIIQLKALSIKEAGFINLRSVELIPID